MQKASLIRAISLLRLTPAIISFLALRGESQEVTLESITQVREPTIENRNLHYVVDLNFSATPRHYWLYYSTPEQRMVIDIYGETLEQGEELDLPVSNIFSSLKTWSRHSEIALSRVRSQVALGVDPGWYFSEQRISGTTIRVSACRPLPPPEAPPPSRDPLVHFLVGSFAVVSAFFLTFGILQYSQ